MLCTNHTVRWFSILYGNPAFGQVRSDHMSRLRSPSSSITLNRWFENFPNLIGHKSHISRFWIAIVIKSYVIHVSLYVLYNMTPCIMYTKMHIWLVSWVMTYILCFEAFKFSCSYYFMSYSTHTTVSYSVRLSPATVCGNQPTLRWVLKSRL